MCESGVSSAADLQCIIDGIIKGVAVSQQASMNDIIKGVAASQQASMNELKAYISEALGGIITRVEAVETSVTALQTEMATIKGQINQTDCDAISSDVNHVIPSLVAAVERKTKEILNVLLIAEKAAFSKELVIRGLADQIVDLPKAVCEILEAVGVDNAQLMDVGYVGRVNVKGQRLVVVKMKTEQQTQLIMNGKKKLKEHESFGSIFINYQTSQFRRKCAAKMRGFYRLHKDSLEMKISADCIQFVKEKMHIPVFEFFEDNVTVGSSIFKVPVANTPPACTSSAQVVNSSSVSQRNAKKRGRTMSNNQIPNTSQCEPVAIRKSSRVSNRNNSSNSSAIDTNIGI
jgi:hypothetical protein